MKIVVIGGTGLIGSKVVALLRQRGHEALAASPNSGVNTLTGEGLPEALAGAQVVVDLANSPSFEDAAVMTFFQTSERNLLPAETLGGRPASCCAVHRRHRPVAGQWLFSRQGRTRDADRDLRHPLYHHPLDAVPGVPRRHRRFKRGWRRRQTVARPVPADRGGGRRRLRCRCCARGAAQRHRRDRRPGKSAVQRDRRPLSASGRRQA